MDVPDSLLTGSAHAPPIKGVRADCDSQHDKKIKRDFLLMPAILAAQQPPFGIYKGITIFSVRKGIV